MNSKLILSVACGMLPGAVDRRVQCAYRSHVRRPPAVSWLAEQGPIANWSPTSKFTPRNRPPCWWPRLSTSMAQGLPISLSGRKRSHMAAAGHNELEMSCVAIIFIKGRDRLSGSRGSRTFMRTSNMVLLLGTYCHMASRRHIAFCTY